MRRTEFTAPTTAGPLVGWTTGHGPPVLVLHGGPELEYTHMEGLVEQLAGEYRVATFQQRGLAPSAVEGPFTIGQAVDDIVAVLDHLDIERALLVASSWGGHLGFHVAVAIPHRLRGVLAVDPLGAVGDCGLAEFGRTMLERLTPDARARADELDAVEEAEGPSEETLRESWRLFWPCYFADPSAASPVIPQAASVAAYLGLFAALTAERERLEAALPTIRVPVGIVAGPRAPCLCPPHWAPRTGSPARGSRSSTTPATSRGWNDRGSCAPHSTG